MSAPVAVIDYLSRSNHRVEVLEAICESPRTRDEIRDLADASRVTVGRILTDLEEREWIERDGQAYVATDRGEYVTSEFTRLVANLDAYDSLPPVTTWYPDNEPSFDLACLQDATVVNSDAADLMGPIRRSLNLIDSAERVHALANGASVEFIQGMRTAVEAGASHQLVLPEQAVTAIWSDDNLQSDVAAMFETGRLSLHSIDRDLPVLLIADETVALCSGDHGCMVETDDQVVYEWAESYFASVRDEAEAIPPEQFDVGPNSHDGQPLVE